jgi:hypothetical protein
LQSRRPDARDDGRPNRVGLLQVVNGFTHGQIGLATAAQRRRESQA